MDTIPNEIFAIICSYLQPRTLGVLTSCSKPTNKLVKSDTVLRYHKQALYKRWYYHKKIESYGDVTSIYDRIQLRIKNQNRWKLQSQPFGYVLPVGEDKISTIKCKRNRLLVISVSASKATKLSVYDLETLKLLGTTETQLIRGNNSKVLWKGNDRIVFLYMQRFYSWNINQPTVEPIIFPDHGPTVLIHPEFAFYDGIETLNYVRSHSMEFTRYNYNIRTKEVKRVDWIQCKDVYFWINFNIRTVIYQKSDGKYYMEKYTADWKRSSSLALEVLDCYGSIEFKITDDYIFLFYSDQTTPTRIFSSVTGQLVLRIKMNNYGGLTRVKYSKDGTLIHEWKRNKAVVSAYTLKNNRLDEIQWISPKYPNLTERTVLKIITNDLALIKYGKSIAFQTSKTKNDIISGAKLTPQISKLVPNEYATWRVMDTVLSETQIILHMQSPNKQNTIVVLDYCNSVVQK